MDFCSSAARGRQAVSAFFQRLATIGLLLVAALGLGWSGDAAAQAACPLTPVTTTPNIGAPGSTLTFSFSTGTGTFCGTTVTGNITVLSGGATVAPPTFSTPSSTTVTMTVTLPMTPGVTGTVRAQCTSFNCGGAASIAEFTYSTFNDFDYTPTTPLAITTNEISTFTVGTNLVLNGSPGTVGTTFTQLPATVYGTVTPDAAGDASISRSIAVDGTYTVRAELACPRLLEGCTSVPPIDFNVTVEPVSVTAVGSTTPSTVAGTPLGLIVRYGSASIPAPNGTPMTWTVAGPAGGDGVVTGNPVAGGAGRSSASFSATVPGVYTVTANSGCTFCGPGFVSFTVTVTPLPTLAINGGNNQTSQVGTAFPTPLSVVARNSGVPAGGVTINWVVTSGSASITPGGPTDPTGGVASATVVPVAAGPITITATRADAPGVFVTFNLTGTSLPHTLNPVSADPAAGTDGSPISFTVRLLQAGAPVNAANIQWSSTAPFSPANFTSATNAAGDAVASFTPSAPGSFANAVRADYDPDGIPASGDEVFYAFDVDVAALPTLTIVGGNGQSGAVGVDYPDLLSVIAEDSGTPVSGVGVNWVLTSGNAAISPSGPTTDPTGRSHLSVQPTAPGVITITATRTDAPAATVTFSLTATGFPYTLVAVTPNPLSGVINSPVPVTVRLLQGGTPINGATVVWNAGPPFAPAATSSTTNAAGDATATFTPSAAGTFPNVITAFVDPDGIAANGDEVSLNYSANIAFTAGLAATGGNGQSALPGAAFALPLTVHADNSGTSAAGVTINWAVTVGGVSLSSPTSVTDGTGHASITVLADDTSGPVTIVASRQDVPTATATFNLAVASLGTMSIIGGDDQLLIIGTPSDPMTVELRDAAGVPVAGAVVTWTTSSGTLDRAGNGGTGKALNETTTTDASGRTSNTVTISAAGPVQVTASSPLAEAPAVFNHNSALGDLEGLDPTQETVAHAVDEFCPALAALPSRTPQQQDLLDRCRELVDASVLDPGSTALALDQMMADVALTQVNAAFNAAQSQFQNLKTRIAALRSGTGGTSFGGLALNTPTGPVSLGMLASAFGEDEGAPAEIGADFSRWGFFAAGTIGRGEAEAGSRSPAYDYDLDGITAGVDYRKNDKWIFGGSLGYTRQDTSLPGGRGGLDTTGWSISAYSTFYQQDSWYMDGVVTWGHNNYELIRQIVYTLPTPGGGTTTIEQIAEADAGGDLLSTAFTFGRDFNRGALGIGPYGRLLYTRLGFDEINEDLLPGVPGSGLGLRIENRDVTSLATVLGTKFTYTWSTDWGVLMPHAQLEWEHEFKDDPQSIEARFINDPTGSAMVLRGDPLDTDYFRLGLGMSMVLTRGRSGFFYYERLVGRNGMSQWNLALGLRLEF